MAGAGRLRRFAGNCTPFSSIANLIVLQQAAKKTSLSFWEFTRVGISSPSSPPQLPPACSFLKPACFQACEPHRRPAGVDTRRKTADSRRRAEPLHKWRSLAE